MDWGFFYPSWSGPFPGSSELYKRLQKQRLHLSADFPSHEPPKPSGETDEKWGLGEAPSKQTQSGGRSGPLSLELQLWVGARVLDAVKCPAQIV